MLIGIYDKYQNSYRSNQVIQAIQDLGHEAELIRQWEITVSSFPFNIKLGSRNAQDYDLLFIANLGRESPTRANFRLNLFDLLMSHGSLIVNSPKTIRITRDKAQTFFILSEQGLPIPPTLITEQPSEVLAFVERYDSCILKPTIGSQGRGIFFLDAQMSESTLLSLLDHYSRLFGEGLFLVQKKLETEGFDIRALIVGEEQISVYKRVFNQSGLANLHRGGKPIPCDIDIGDLALRAAKSVGGGIVGVDLIHSPEGLVITEINSCPGWKGEPSLQRVDVSNVIAKYLVEKKLAI
ncbi:MAG: RimK family alpha-L-glutamate ligase [Candidatus Hodarchaeota archaeon]